LPTALITGVTGQDGSYLAELLLERGYETWGMVRTSQPDNLCSVSHLLTGSGASSGTLNIVEGDLTDSEKLRQIVGDIRPDEIYNLAAQSFLPIAYEDPVYTIDVNGLGPVRLLGGNVWRCGNSSAKRAN
jgi:GDPmannose 4,6-dehydratase